MTAISGTGYYNWEQLQFQRSPQNQSQLAITNSNAGVFSASGTNSAGTAQAANGACEDGKDDGSIGFWGALKNIGKGCLKFVTNMFTDENGDFSLGQTLKTLAIGAAIGAVCFLTAGTAVPAIMAAGGVAMSAYGFGKAAVNVACAKTDAEAEQAWQDIGTNGVALGLSVAGAKSVAKSMHTGTDYSGWRGTANAVKDVFVDSKNAIASNFSGVSSGQSLSANLSTIKSNVSNNITEFGTQVKGNYYKTVANNASAQYKKSFDDYKNAVKNADQEAAEAAYNNMNKYRAEYQAYTEAAANPTAPNMPKMPTWQDVTDSYRYLKDTPVKDIVTNVQSKARTVRGTARARIGALHREGVQTYRNNPQLIGLAASYAGRKDAA